MAWFSNWGCSSSKHFLSCKVSGRIAQSQWVVKVAIHGWFMDIPGKSIGCYPKLSVILLWMIQDCPWQHLTYLDILVHVHVHAAANTTTVASHLSKHAGIKGCSDKWNNTVFIHSRTVSPHSKYLWISLFGVGQVKAQITEVQLSITMYMYMQRYMYIHVAVPGRNWTLFCCIFRSHCCVQRALACNFR